MINFDIKYHPAENGQHIKKMEKKMSLDARKPGFGGLRTTKAQTSLISAFVIRLLENIISRLAAGEISIF